MFPAEMLRSTDAVYLQKYHCALLSERTLLCFLCFASSSLPLFPLSFSDASVPSYLRRTRDIAEVYLASAIYPFWPAQAYGVVERGNMRP